MDNTAGAMRDSRGSIVGNFIIIKGVKRKSGGKLAPVAQASRWGVSRFAAL
jgi:hypothetical protein